MSLDIAPYVIAIDGGGSKTDATAIALDGTILGRAQAVGSSPHLVGLDASVATMHGLVSQLLQRSGIPQHVSIYLSGLDLAQEIADYRAAVAVLPWGMSGLTVDNDLFALLRAGTSSPDAAAVICGTGINAIGIRADGQTARFVALGPISGDWGGAIGLGEQALWHAARQADGRGPVTSLTPAITAHFGFATIGELSEAIHLGTVNPVQLATLSPIIFAHAAAGDSIAASIVDRQAEEIAVMAGSALRRLGLGDAEVPVVLGGGVLRSRDARLMSGVTARLAQLAPGAHTLLVDSPPILGAGLLALESAGASAAAVEAARAALA